MPTRRTPSKNKTQRPSAREASPASAADEVTSARDYSRNDSDRIRSRASAQRKQAHSRRIWIAVVVAIVVLGLATAVLAWNQWFSHDDAADFQGEWTMVDSGYEVTITADKIYLTTHLGYDYSLDTFAKTVSFSYEDLSGKGTYVFSSDRNTLTIAEVGEASSTGEATTLNTVLQRKGTTQQTSSNG